MCMWRSRLLVMLVSSFTNAMTCPMAVASFGTKAGTLSNSGVSRPTETGEPHSCFAWLICRRFQVPRRQSFGQRRGRFRGCRGVDSSARRTRGRDAREYVVPDVCQGASPLPHTPHMATCEGLGVDSFPGDRARSAGSILHSPRLARCGQNVTCLERDAN